MCSPRKSNENFSIFTFYESKQMSLTQDLRWSLGRSIALQLQRQTDLLLCTINCFLQWDHLPNMAVGDLAFYYTLYLCCLGFLGTSSMLIYRFFYFFRHGRYTFFFLPYFFPNFLIFILRRKNTGKKENFVKYRKIRNSVKIQNSYILLRALCMVLLNGWSWVRLTRSDTQLLTYKQISSTYR